MTEEMLTTALVLSGLFLILFVWERWIPLRQSRQALSHRLMVNLSISTFLSFNRLVIVNFQMDIDQNRIARDTLCGYRKTLRPPTGVPVRLRLEIQRTL